MSVRGGRDFMKFENRFPLDEVLKPMNAVAVKNKAKMEALWDNPSYIAEEKLDGSRYLAIGGRFFSRRTSVKDGFPVEKTENIPHLHTILKHFPKAIVDGEVFIPGQKSNNVVSIMGSKPERAVELQNERGLLQYRIFDILRAPDGSWLLDKPWSERRKLLEIFHMMVDRHSAMNLEGVLTITDAVYENKRRYCQEILANGGEGVILKNVDKPYKPDKRPAWHWVKVKTELTDDVVIMDYLPPERVYTGKDEDTWQYWEYNTPVTKYHAMGWIGSVVFGKYKDGKLVELGSTSGMTEEIREELSHNKDKYIGETIEIRAMEQTEEGHYRHPAFVRFRPDKDPTACVIND